MGVVLFGVEVLFVPFGEFEPPEVFGPLGGFELPLSLALVVGFAVVPPLGEFAPAPVPLVGGAPPGFAIGKPRPGMPLGAPVAPIPC